MDTTKAKSIIDSRECDAWPVSANRWHASTYTRTGTCALGEGATARAAAEDAARHARLLDEGSPAELDAALAALRATLAREAGQ